MEQRGPETPSVPAESPCHMEKLATCGDEELDEETMNYLSALYTALGPLLPELTNLQGNQDPPAHLMIDIKSKLRELGYSVWDAKNMLLQYNMYLKKRLAKAAQEQKALKEDQGEDISKQDLTPPESQKLNPPDGIRRRTSSHLASLGEDNSWSLQEQAEEVYSSPLGTPKSASRTDSLSSHHSNQSLS